MKCLADVPAVSIYRHVARLTEAGVLQVVAERRVRATTERTYALRVYAAQLQPDEIAGPRRWRSSTWPGPGSSPTSGTASPPACGR